MITLGLIAIIQMALLPGFLIAYGFQLRNGGPRLLTCSFCLSALFNFYFVQACVALSVYTSTTVYALVAMELLGLSYLLYRRGTFTTNEMRPEIGRAAITPLRAGAGGHPSSPLTKPHAFVVIAALALLAYAAIETLFRIGDTFVIGDAINSWNRWAREMAGNAWPHRTRGYPQLIPANYSLSYLFIRDLDIWFFAKAWVSWFFFVLLLSIYQLYRDEDRWEIALSLTLTFGLFYQVMTSQFAYGGIVDIALATFAFNAVASVLRASRHTNMNFRKRELVLGALFTVGCALTKQGGLFLLLSYPLLVWLLVIKPSAPPQRRELIRFALGIMVPGTLLAVFPWYALHALGADDKLIAPILVLDLHHGRGVLERLVHAVALLEGRVSTPVVVTMAGLIAASMTVPRYRLVTLVVTLPYCLLWALGFSYDHRNIALALPLLALSSAFGAGVVWRNIKAPAARAGLWSGAVRRKVNTPVPGTGLLAGAVRRKIKALAPGAGLSSAVQIRYGLVTTLIAGLLLALNSHFNDERLVRLHNSALVTTAGVPALNLRLRDYFRENPLPGKILTTYKTIRWMPPLMERYYPQQIHRFTSIERYLKLLNDRDVGFVLYDSRKTLPEVTRYLETGVGTGEFERIFSYRDRFVFYRKLKAPQQATLERPAVRPEKHKQR